MVYRKRATDINARDVVLRQDGGFGPAARGPERRRNCGRSWWPDLGPRGQAPAGGGGGVCGEDEYYLAFVGTPSVTTPWMLQFGGHHLAIN
jgi:hypothetical protein